MATDRPTDLPRWAEAPPDPGNVDEPPTSKQEEGWLFRDPPAFQLVNWMWRQLTRWAQHFADSASRFPSPEAAYAASLPGTAAPLAPGLAGDVSFNYNDGGSCVVDGTLGHIPAGPIGYDPPGTQDPGTLALGSVLEGEGQQAIEATGRSVVLVRKIAGPIGVDEDPTNQYEVIQVDRDLSTVVRTYYTGAPGEHIHALYADGVDVIFGVEDEVRRYDHDTGALIWATTIPGTGEIVKGIAAAGGYVWAVSANAGAEACQFLRAGGSVHKTFDHGGALWAICHYGDRLFVAGAASSYPSGANLRCLPTPLISGQGMLQDPTDEGGNGNDQSGPFATDIAWNKVVSPQVGDPSYRRSMVTDGRALFTIQGAILRRRELTAGRVVGSLDFAAEYLTPSYLVQIEYDQDYIYVITNLRISSEAGVTHGKMPLYAVTPSRFLIAWGVTSNLPPTTVRGIASDCHALFAGWASRINRGTETQRWQRVSPGTRGPGGENYLPKRQVMLPAYWPKH
jgi:hypothetical protein